MLWSIWMRLGWLSVCSVPITVTKRRGWGDREGILPVWLLCQFSPRVPGSPQGFLYYPNVLHPSQQSVPIFPVQVTIIQLSTGRWRRKERACAEKGVWVESRNRPKRTTEKQRCPSILVKPCDGAFLTALVPVRGRRWAYLKMMASIWLELGMPFKLNVCIPSPDSQVGPVIA